VNTKSARKIRFDLSTESAITSFLAFVSQHRLSGKKPLFELVPEKRTLSQNDMAFALYTQIAGQAQDQSISDIRRECKLVHGIPILRRDDAGFANLYDKSIRGTLTYEEKLQAMEWFPVTSLMDKPQFTEYLDTIIREYSKNGYSLINPYEQESLRAVV